MENFALYLVISLTVYGIFNAWFRRRCEFSICSNNRQTFFETRRWMYCVQTIKANSKFRVVVFRFLRGRHTESEMVFSKDSATLLGALWVHCSVAVRLKKRIAALKRVKKIVAGEEYVWQESCYSVVKAVSSDMVLLEDHYYNRMVVPLCELEKRW